MIFNDMIISDAILEEDHIHLMKIEVCWIITNLFYGDEDDIKVIIDSEINDPASGKGHSKLEIIPLISKTLDQ